MTETDLPYVVEAVQFRQWGPWHAVKNPPVNETTCCGRDSKVAEKMWRDWESDDEIFPSDRCQICAKAAPLSVALHLVTENESGATCNCGRSWSFWGSAHSQREGTRYHANVVPLLKASARKHAVAANAKLWSTS